MTSRDIFQPSTNHTLIESHRYGGNFKIFIIFHFFKVRIFDIILFPIFKQVGFLYVSLLDISTYLFLISIFILFFYFYDIRARGRKIEIVCEREMSVFTSQSQILVTFHETLYLL